MKARNLRSLNKNRSSNLTAVIVFLLLASLFVIGVLYSNQHFSSTEISSNNEVLSAQSNKNDHISAKLLSDTDQSNVPASSKRITIHTQIVNDTYEGIEISPLLQFTLVGNDGAEYPYTAAFIGDKIIGGSISAGDMFDENLDFIIPSDIDPEILHYKQTLSTPPQKISIQ